MKGEYDPLQEMSRQSLDQEYQSYPPLYAVSSFRLVAIFLDHQVQAGPWVSPLLGLYLKPHPNLPGDILHPFIG